jgi:hypothetical protein
MLARRLAWMFALGVAAASLAVEACSSSDSVAPVVDGGVEAAAETGPPDSATCDLGANLLDQIPDADIPDSSTTTGICLGCVSAKCGSSITQCNQSCPCQAEVASGLQCYVKNPSDPLGCVTPFFAGGDPQTKTIALTLLPCVQSGCPVECGQKGSSQGDGGDTD